MTTTVELSPGQLETLREELEDPGGYVNLGGTLFRSAKPVGTCPACSQPVYNEDEEDGPVWTCPADFSLGNPWREEPAEWITDELREREGCYSNCAEDFGKPCYGRMPLHEACYDGGQY